MGELMKWGNYGEYEAAFDRAYRNTVDNYILMGYMLRKAQDTDILHDSGYKTVADFAWNRYKIKPDTVSRMVAVNKRFSEGGYSHRLEGKYEGYAATALAEMLQLPDAIIEALPEGTTRAEIRDLKAEYREEQKITPLEVSMETPPEGGYQPRNSLEGFIKEYYRERPDEYFLFQQQVIKTTRSSLERTVEDSLSPSGQRTMTARVPGKGKYMLAIKGRGQDVKLVNMRTGETETYTFTELADSAARICMVGKYGYRPEQAWEWLTGDHYETKQDTETGGTQVNTGGAGEPAEEKAAEAQDGLARKEDKVKESGDSGGGDGNDHGDGEKKQDEKENRKVKDDEADPKGTGIAPAQPEQGDQAEESPVEVIESPYREHMDDAKICLRQIEALIDRGSYEEAYSIGAELLEALRKMKTISQQKDVQIDGQIGMEEYISR